MELEYKKVKCPKHNQELRIEYTSLNIMGNKYPVVMGMCSSCKTRYLSREILSSSGSFSVAGQSYEYLNALEQAHPHPFKPISAPPQKNTSANIEVPPSPKQSSVSKPIEIKNHTNDKKQKNDAKKASNDTPKASKVQKQKQRILEKKVADLEVTRKQFASGKGKPPHVHKLSFPSIMPRVCSKDGRELFFASEVIIDVGYRGVSTRALYCTKCRTAYIPIEEQARVREEVIRAELRLAPKAETVVQPRINRAMPNEPVNLAVPQNTLYVCKGLISCKRNAHNVESATGVLLGRNGAAIKINTNYCPQCYKYFISYDEYSHYRRIYGILLGNIKVTNGSFFSSETELEDESILHICGYSVNQNENLSAFTRRNILRYLIDSKISNKPEIIQYLSYFIRRNGKRKNMDEAVRRWNDDLTWVREYQIDRQRHFEIANIHKNK